MNKKELEEFSKILSKENKELKERVHEMSCAFLSILDSLKLYDKDSLCVQYETLSEIMFRKMKGYNIDLNKELGFDHLKPVPLEESQKEKHKITIEKLSKILAIEGISTTISFDSSKRICYLDLETNAKSHLYLYEDGMLYGRYDYKKQLDLSKTEEELLLELCHEFNNALHHRKFGQEGWFNLCNSLGVELNAYI